MLNLLIAILISLGCNVDSTQITSEDQLRAQYGETYEKARDIAETGTYKEEDGGVVIIDVVGD